MTDTVVVIYSGGMDSFTLLHRALARGLRVHALSFDYGQRHVRELACARQVCQALAIPHKVLDIRAMSEVMSGSSLTSDIDVPEGHYEEESMKATVVPNRNMIMLSVAVGWALALKFDAVAYGAHSGDHAIYPDCREEFAEALDQAVRLCDWHAMKLMRPFVKMDKGEIAKRGAELGVPFELTWTCYKGGEVHCGKCGACQERREAFATYGINDPVAFESS